MTFTSIDVVVLTVVTLLAIYVITLGFAKFSNPFSIVEICSIGNISIKYDNNSKIVHVSTVFPVAYMYIINCSTMQYMFYAGTSIDTKFNPNEQVLVVITHGNITVFGDLNCINQVIYVSPCGISTIQPLCEPWIELPDLKSSLPKVKKCEIHGKEIYLWIGGLTKAIVR